MFTIEAFLSLLVVISLFGAVSLLRASESALPKFVLLADTWEVLEKGYHGDLAAWIDADACDTTCMVSVQRISSVLNRVGEKTGQRISLRYGEKKIPAEGCEEETKIARLTVSARARQEDGGPWHRVWISLCR